MSPIARTTQTSTGAGRPRNLQNLTLAASAFKRVSVFLRAQNPSHRPSRPHDHRHVSRQPRPRLLALAKRISRTSRPHLDPSYSPPPLGRTPAPEARFLLPSQAWRPITTRLLLPSRSPRWVKDDWRAPRALRVRRKGPRDCAQPDGHAARDS